MRGVKNQQEKLHDGEAVETTIKANDFGSNSIPSSSSAFFRIRHRNFLFDDAPPDF